MRLILHYLTLLLVLLILGCDTNPPIPSDLSELSADKPINNLQLSLVPVEEVNHSVRVAPVKPGGESSRRKDKGKEKIKDDTNAPHNGEEEQTIEPQRRQETKQLNELFVQGKRAYKRWRKSGRDTDCQAAIQWLDKAGQQGHLQANKLLSRLRSKVIKFQQYQKAERKRRANLSPMTTAKNRFPENLGGLPVEIWTAILSYANDREMRLAKQVNHTLEGLVDSILNKRLQKAILEADDNQVKELIKCGIDLQLEDKNGLTPLYLAADKGHLAIVKLLLQHQEYISIKGADRFLPGAAEQTRQEMAALLIEEVAQIKLHHKYTNTKDQAGNTPLHVAAKLGRLEVVNLILKRGPHLMYTLNNKGQLPLHLAAEDGHTEIVKLLKSVYAVDDNGHTPLHLAAKEGHLAVVKVLLQKGAHVNVRDNNHNTPLHLAALNRQLEIARLLLAKGAHTNLSNGEGLLPIQIAIENNQEELVKLLTRI